MDITDIHAELDKYISKYGFQIPDRGLNENDSSDNIKWRDGKPDYAQVNLEYFKGKSKNHSQGSQEEIAEKTVKRWEMELMHKMDLNQWDTVDLPNFTIRVNGGKPIGAYEAQTRGSYNWLLEDCHKELYDYKNETRDSAQALFLGTFKNGFPFEVLRVFSGPPKVVFTWRHWGVFNGEYKGVMGDGKTYNMYGINVVEHNDDMKIKSIDIYYKPEEFLEGLLHKRDAKDMESGQNLIGNICPFASKF